MRNSSCLRLCPSTTSARCPGQSGNSVGPGTTTLRPLRRATAVFAPGVGVSDSSMGGFSRTTYWADVASTKGRTPWRTSSRSTGTKRPSRRRIIRSVFERLIFVGPT